MPPPWRGASFLYIYIYIYVELLLRVRNWRNLVFLRMSQTDPPISPVTWVMLPFISWADIVARQFIQPSIYPYTSGYASLWVSITAVSNLAGKKKIDTEINFWRFLSGCCTLRLPSREGFWGFFFFRWAGCSDHLSSPLSLSVAKPPHVKWKEKLENYSEGKG